MLTLPFNFNIPVLLSHLPVFLALIIILNHLFSSKPTFFTVAEARHQRDRDRAIDHKLRRICHAMELLGLMSMKLKVAPNFLNGAIVEDLNMNVDARDASVDGARAGDGGGEGGRWDDDDGGINDYDGYYRDEGGCGGGRRGGNRGRGGYAVNLFEDGSRGMGPSRHPAPAFFAPMFRARACNQPRTSARWNVDELSFSEPEHWDVVCEYRLPADDGDGDRAPNFGRSEEGPGGVQEEQEQSCEEEWHSEASTAVDTEEEGVPTLGVDIHGVWHGRPNHGQPMFSPSPPAHTNPRAHPEPAHVSSRTISANQVPTYTSHVQRPPTSLQATGQGLAFVPGDSELQNSRQSQRHVKPYTQSHTQRTDHLAKELLGQLRTVSERPQSTSTPEAQQGSTPVTDFRGQLQHTLRSQPQNSNEARHQASFSFRGARRDLSPTSTSVRDDRVLRNNNDDEYQQAPVSSIISKFEEVPSSAKPNFGTRRNNVENASTAQSQLVSQPQPRNLDDENANANQELHLPPLKRCMEHYDGPAWSCCTSTPPSGPTLPTSMVSTLENPASRLDTHSSLTPSPEHYFEHAQPLAPGPLQQPRRKRWMTIADSELEIVESPLVPLPLNIVKKKPTLTHAQNQAATSFNNELVDTNPPLPQQRQGHQDFLWQREQERQEQMMINREREVQHAYIQRYAACWPRFTCMPERGERFRQPQPQLERRDDSNAQSHTYYRRQHNPQPYIESSMQS